MKLKPVRLSRKPNKMPFFQAYGFITFSFFCLVIVVPMLWAIYTSFKGDMEFNEDPFGLPKVWEWENYVTAIKYFRVLVQDGIGTRYVYIFEMTFNTLMYAIPGTISMIACHYFMAYITVIYPNRFSKFLYWMILMLMIVPISGSTVAEIDWCKQLGLYDNWPGYLFRRYAFTGMYFLMMHENIKTSSKSIAEAAEIDGAGRFHIMLGIVLPQVWGLVSTLTLLTFITQWNNYMDPKLFMPSYPTIAWGLFEYTRTGSNEIASSTAMRLAGCMILFVPVFTLFCIFRSKIMGNMSYGAVKE